MLYYRKTDEIQKHVDTCYYKNRGKFKLDNKLSHYELEGYGNMTYFTIYTKDTVIVSIRGTEFLRVYDWLIDLDTWMESFIYQVNHFFLAIIVLLSF